MRFEVPQFIDVEDKIFGPFTWRQFVYLAGGTGACVMLYLLLPFWLFFIFATPIAALAGGLAFLPINNRPLVYFIEAMVKYATSARLYIWKREDVRPSFAKASESTTPLYTPPSTNTIASLSRQLELNALAKGTGDDDL